MGDIWSGLTHAGDEAYQGFAGIMDSATGNVDESVGRAVDSATEGDLAGVGDAAAGSLDEAVGQATEGILTGDWAAVGDAAAGNVDEAIGRTGSELNDGDALGALSDALGGFDNAVGQNVEGGLQIWDAAAGSTDESVARQFDDEEGGGFADILGEDYVDPAADAAAGAASWTFGGITDWFMENPIVLLFVVGGVFVAASGAGAGKEVV